MGEGANFSEKGGDDLVGGEASATPIFQRQGTVVAWALRRAVVGHSSDQRSAPIRSPIPDNSAKFITHSLRLPYRLLFLFRHSPSSSPPRCRQ
ncbi:hypothetical protein SDJN02_25222, partial [Cucurbita argyrosperma subsp. argyrosperma]